MNNWHVVWCHSCNEWLDDDRTSLMGARRLRDEHLEEYINHEISIYEEVD